MVDAGSAKRRVRLPKWHNHWLTILLPATKQPLSAWKRPPGHGTAFALLVLKGCARILWRVLLPVAPGFIPGAGLDLRGLNGRRA